MLPNMNPQQMQKLMKQMGINSKEIKAIRVVIEMDDENIVITDPQITEINMQGQTSFQIAGKTEKQAKTNEEDLKLIMEKTGCSREKALELLKNANGDIAEAIMAAEQ
jgi:nascent polypeptide-associated complex subunit alpha